MKILEIRNLSKNYGKVLAVDNISFDLAPDEIFALIGPNGAGKSTTLRMIATLLSPTSGTIKVMGNDVVTQPEKVRRSISYLPEEAGAYKNLSGYDYLQLMAGLYADNSADAQRFVKKAEEICGLGARLKDKASTYSKGMSRKLLLARTVMVKPALAILDEPTSGLDVVNAFEIRKIIKNLAKEGMGVLLSSHNMLEIEYLAHRVAIVAGGKIHDVGTPQQLKKRYSAQNLEEVFITVVKR